MPDLHTDAVHAFWDSYDRRTLYRIIVSIEKVESWTMDHVKEIRPAIIRLGEALDSATGLNLKDKDQLIRVLTNTHASKALRILQSIDTAEPGTASQILMHAEESTEDDSGDNSHAKMFLRRNLVFERLQLLSRVFAPQRLGLIVNALEYLNE